MFLVPVRKRHQDVSVWDDLFNFDRSTSFQNQDIAPIEIENDDKTVYVKVELPGVKKEDVTIEYTDGILSISGEKKTEEKKTEQGVSYTEISRGSFKRRINVGQDIDFSKGSATYAEGVLTISLPKVVPSSPSRLAIS